MLSGWLGFRRQFARGKIMKKVSVIIPVTRERLAQKAEASVRTQEYPELEVIKMKAEGLGPAEARNKGAKRARGEILLFLDDDCEAGPNWVRENLKELEDKKIGAVGGYIEGRSKRYFARSLDFANFSLCQLPHREERVVSSTTLGMRRCVFEKVGGFDPTLRVKEDTDLCYRIIREGFKVVYQPKVRIVHNHGRETLKDLLIYQYRNGRISGLEVEHRYMEMEFSRRLGAFNCALVRIGRYPLVYLLCVLPLGLFATLFTLAINLPYHPEVLVLAPGIFLGKLATQLGIFVWTLKRPLILA